MAQKGMNTVAVAQWGKRVQGTDAGEIRSRIQAVCTQAMGLEWTGPDYETFKSTKVQAVEAAMKTLEQALVDMGNTAFKNASEQDTASA